MYRNYGSLHNVSAFQYVFLPRIDISYLTCVRWQLKTRRRMRRWKTRWRRSIKLCRASSCSSHISLQSLMHRWRKSQVVAVLRNSLESKFQLVMACIGNSCPLSAKLHYMDTGYGHGRLRICCTTPPTDELTTVLQLVVQQIHHQRTKICHIPKSWHVEMLGCGIAMWQICCTTSCRIVVSLSVGGVVQHTCSRCLCCGVWH